MKKRILLLAAALLLLCGCTTKYVAPTASPDGLQTAKGKYIQVSYPADQWEVYVTKNYFSMVQTGLPEEEACTASVTLFTYEKEGELAEEDVEGLTLLMKDMMLQALTIELHEFRQVGGRQVLYMESLEEYTEETLEMIRELGVDESLLESFGGFEGMLEMPPTYHACMFVTIGGELFCFSGTYPDEAGKEILLNCLETMVSTAQ